jgi:hypothetical protein
MTTFDVHTGSGGDAPRAGYEPLGDSLSTLDLLREVGSEQVEFEPFVFENPLRLVRFTCRTEIANQELTRWQRGALPSRSGRSGGVPDLTKLDGFRLYARAIAETCEQVEIRRSVDADYQVVADSQGNALAFDDKAFLSSLGVPDKLIAVKKLMAGSEAFLINRGQELLEKAGYGDEESDDPLDS